MLVKYQADQGLRGVAPIGARFGEGVVGWWVVIWIVLVGLGQIGRWARQGGKLAPI